VIAEPEPEPDINNEFYGLMANMNQFLQKGLIAIKEAVDADALATETGTSYEPAIQKYLRGLEYIQYARKHEKNPKSKKVLTTKMVQYLDRVEELKNLPFEEDSIELIVLSDQRYPDNFLCHTHRRDYIEWKSGEQMNEAICNTYVTGLPLSFIEEEEDILYG